MDNSLDKLAFAIQHCQRCERGKTRIHAVPGEGNPRANILLLGEAPGKQEDKTGKPFVGRAGTYLDKALSELEWKRDHLFITSILKCYHPGTPKKSQIKACRLWTLRQIDSINPQFILIMGKQAEWGLWEGKRKKSDPAVVAWKGRACVVTCHPAAAMRFPSRNRQFSEDINTLKRLVEKDGII